MKKRAALTLLPSLLLGACSVVGIRDAPEPASTVIGRVGAVEIRSYAPTAAAETTVTGSELYARSIGFQRLFAYITGSNTGRHKIAMTAPVAQARAEKIAMTAPVAQMQASAGAWTVRFFLPPTVTPATAPLPSDPRVAVVAVPARTVAVLRFSGQGTPSDVAGEGRRLDAILATSTWQADGPLVAWFYDPPWTLPPFRRNEVARQVEPRSAQAPSGL
ncbi:SOUL family heme-binding protein [Acidisoma sp.]|uniref:SOUL family heme-binding protein n=1 Tax=Acidisoma sp. TaxID=1872115 RepID=UPI003B00F2AE